jgi:exopolyphosphatase/guanosine-5'-triphosphate,3'-diphosphate pyrophosphatase
MAIATVDNKGMLNVISRDKVMVRLGNSAGDMKLLLPDALERGVGTLEAFAEIAKTNKAEVRAVATSAIREADNKNEFIDKVKEKVGIDIEVVSGAEEGRLIFIGAIHALPLFNKRALIIDIGGGSTEAIIGYRGEVEYVCSAKIGAIRLTKKYFQKEPVTSEDIQECREFIRGYWSHVLLKAHELGFDTMVGCSGTIQNLAAMVLAKQGKPVPEILNGIKVSKKELLDVIEDIKQAPTTAEREKLPGMDPKRSDIILAGALILEYALIALNVDNVLISSFALREGIIYDTIQKRKSVHEFKNLNSLRYQTIYNLCNKYNCDIKHVEFVRDIAIIIFDNLQTLHNLGYYERELLEAASFLHDVGYMISHDEHHRHSYYIITNAIMPGFTNDEAEMIANIARYHRKSHPKKKHENFNKLTPEKQQIVKVLAGILRIAEGIDRRQLQKLINIKVKNASEEIFIEISAADLEIKPDIEVWGAERRKSLLEEALNKKITITAG